MLYFNALPNIIKMHVYEYDDTYKKKFKLVVKELNDKFNKLCYTKRKNIMIKIIKEEYYNNNSHSNDILNYSNIYQNIKLLYNNNHYNIDNNDFNKLLVDYINNYKLIDEFLMDIVENRIYKYFDMIQTVIEDENSIYVYKNYDFIKQPHLFNFKAYMNDIFEKWWINNNIVSNNYNSLLKKAQIFYNKYNGLFINNKTIQIRYDCNDSRLYYYFI
jgi:hypothetical protein